MKRLRLVDYFVCILRSCSSFYVNKLIKAEAESFLEFFFLDYPIYIYIYIYIYILRRTDRKQNNRKSTNKIKRKYRKEQKENRENHKRKGKRRKKEITEIS